MSMASLFNSNALYDTHTFQNFIHFTILNYLLNTKQGMVEAKTKIKLSILLRLQLVTVYLVCIENLIIRLTYYIRSVKDIITDVHVTTRTIFHYFLFSACSKGGVEYKIGEIFPAGDGCNTCECMGDGTIVCGSKFCGTFELSKEIQFLIISKCSHYLI